MKMLIIVVEYCGSSTTSKYSWKSVGDGRVRRDNLARRAESAWAQHTDAPHYPLCSRSLGDSRPNSHPRLSSERPRTHKSSRVCPFLHDSRWANDMHSTGFADGGKASGHRDNLGESYRALGPGAPALRIDERRQLAERHHCGASLHHPNPSNGHDLLRK